MSPLEDDEEEKESIKGSVSSGSSSLDGASFSNKSAAVNGIGGRCGMCCCGSGRGGGGGS